MTDSLLQPPLDAVIEALDDLGLRYAVVDGLAVRVRALDSLPHLCATTEERTAIDSAIASMSESLVALERRVRTAVRRLGHRAGTAGEARGGTSG